MRNWGISAAAVLASGLLALAAFAATAVSGPQPGAHMFQFDVTDVSGPARGQTLCYV
jgi:hypothetical protein